MPIIKHRAAIISGHSTRITDGTRLHRFVHQYAYPSYSDEIRSAVLMLHGEKAHSRYFSEDAFKKLQGDNKELLIIPGANHVDLYDNIEVIPFGKIERFFNEHLR